MRSGVLAQKVGMTRLFTEGGEHVPVTVLRLGNCQVVGHRTKEKNGYVALQLGAGSRKVQARPRPIAATSPSPRSSPSASLPNSASTMMRSFRSAPRSPRIISSSANMSMSPAPRPARAGPAA